MKLINGIADSSTIIAMASGSVSSCLGALANSHKLAKRLELIEREQRRAQQREKELTARIASLEVRRDLEDAGKNWKDEVVRLRTEQPGISMRALGRAIGVSDTAIRKHLKASSQ
jgi:3-keto-L-gulonate-6-phosphate decarboxylase